MTADQLIGVEDKAEIAARLRTLTQTVPLIASSALAVYSFLIYPQLKRDAVLLDFWKNVQRDMEGISNSFGKMPLKP